MNVPVDPRPRRSTLQRAARLLAIALIVVVASAASHWVSTRVWSRTRLAVAGALVCGLVVLWLADRRSRPAA